MSIDSRVRQLERDTVGSCPDCLKNQFVVDIGGELNSETIKPRCETCSREIAFKRFTVDVATPSLGGH